ncbi:Folic acid synthesis protein fol1 [Fusarium oxysporum f. sp. albedinis]|nr:Folic acid synthesis protein fol1 [Fusarium oxysporum f. sp. albedinis]
MTCIVHSYRFIIPCQLKILVHAPYPSRSTGNLSLMAFPYLSKRTGTRINGKAKIPSKEFPHPGPNLANILGPARGNNASSVKSLI